MTVEQKEQVDSPCLDCPHMMTCNKMCYKRLEWGVFDADKEDEELSIYGNNLKVLGSERVRMINIEDEEVKKLLKEFSKFYYEVVNTSVYSPLFKFLSK